MLSLFNKADYEVVYPEGFSGSCCGMMFNTRGFNHVADGLANDLEESLVKASGEWFWMEWGQDACQLQACVVMSVWLGLGE